MDIKTQCVYCFKEFVGMKLFQHHVTICEKSCTCRRCTNLRHQGKQGIVHFHHNELEKIKMKAEDDKLIEMLKEAGCSVNFIDTEKMQKEKEEEKKQREKRRKETKKFLDLCHRALIDSDEEDVDEKKRQEKIDKRTWTIMQRIKNF
jgi:hypothetical protein